MVVVCYPNLVVFVLSGLSFFFVMHFSVRLLIMLLFETCLYLIRLGSALFAIGYDCPPLLERKEGSLEVLIVSWSTVLGRSDCLRGSVHGFVCCSEKKKSPCLYFGLCCLCKFCLLVLLCRY